MIDNRNHTEVLLNDAMEHICDTHEQPTDPRAWNHLLVYAPTGHLFNALIKRIKYDGKDFASLTLGEVERATAGAKLPTLLKDAPGPLSKGEAFRSWWTRGFPPS